jgi:hypothetical protein
MPLTTDDPVWYLAYGSNLAAERFSCYLTGGRPRGALRRYEGCRDRTPPVRDMGLHLPGRLRFGGSSSVWGGALAFHDRGAEGTLAARVYLITFGQFSDVVAQEARREVAEDLVPTDAEGVWRAPSSVYESVSRIGERDAVPILSFTSARPGDPAAPSAPYLRTIVRGLAQTFAWTPHEAAEYLLAAPGVTPTWSRDSLVALAEAVADPLR